MRTTALIALSCALVFTCNLGAQDAEPKVGDTTKLEIAEISVNPTSVLDINSSQDQPLDASIDTFQEEVKGPAIVSVNAQGELVGQASATVNGASVPIEANITLVSGGVLLGKTVANEDGSFSFPNVSPGSYDIYGCAASYCGNRSCTVVLGNNHSAPVQVNLDQVSQCGCDSGFAEAPATSFSAGSGGTGFSNEFSSVGFPGTGSGGGSSAGAGPVIGRRFRLLAVGGIATAIALGASDNEVSPSE